MSRSSEGKGKKVGGEKRLDLGLSSLIEGKPDFDLERRIADLVAARGLTAEKNGSSAKSKESSATDREKSIFEKLRDDGSWEELSDICEKRLSESRNEDHEARLWWIRSQLELGSVPATILAAPLDSATRALVDPDHESQKEIEPLAGELLYQLANCLRDKGDPSIVVTFLERSYKLTGEHAEDLAEVIDAEVQRLTKESRRKKNKELPERIAALTALRDEIKNPDKQEKKPERKAVASEKNDAVPPPTISRRAVYGTRAALLACILIIGVYAAKPGPELFRFGAPPAEPYAMLIETDATALPMLPEFPRLRKEDRTSLKDILRDFDATALPTGSPNRARANTISNRIQKLARPRVNQPVKKVALDMSGPIESSELREIMEEARAKFKKDATSSKRPAREMQARLSREFRMRPPDIVRGESDRDTIVKGFPWKGQKKLDEYVVVAETTEVRSGPADKNTDVLDELERDDRVRVERDLGGWLRLRSPDDMVGYIRAEDAEPEVAANQEGI